MEKTVHPQTILASAARGTSGNSNAYGVKEAYKCDIFVLVTAVSGTLPTLDLTIQTTDELDASAATWFDVQSLSTITATGNVMTTIEEGLARHIRVSYTIGGTTPSFTFSIRALKHAD